MQARLRLGFSVAVVPSRLPGSTPAGVCLGIGVNMYADKQVDGFASARRRLRVWRRLQPSGLHVRLMPTSDDACLHANWYVARDLEYNSRLTNVIRQPELFPGSNCIIHYPKWLIYSNCVVIILAWKFRMLSWNIDIGCSDRCCIVRSDELGYGRSMVTDTTVGRDEAGAYPTTGSSEQLRVSSVLSKGSLHSRFRPSETACGRSDSVSRYYILFRGVPLSEVQEKVYVGQQLGQRESSVRQMPDRRLPEEADPKKQRHLSKKPFVT